MFNLNVLIAWVTDGSLDPGGLPNLECEERFSERVFKSAFPGGCSLQDSLKICYCLSSESGIFSQFLSSCRFVI